MSLKWKSKTTSVPDAVPDETAHRAKNFGESPAARLDNPWIIFGICAILMGMVWMVFGQTTGFDFVNFDDEKYISNNAAVTAGLTIPGLESAFGSAGRDNWIPLTTLSHMIDYQFYGLNAGGHHFTNVLLHATTVVLLFLMLHRMTGAMWRSALAAAIFAIHPLRAESVAWVSERKDVLCGVFFMLTLWCYAGYAKAIERWKGGRRQVVRQYWLYFASLFFAACALMSKPMAVTLPLVLLLLDYWPLNRFNGSKIQRLVIEKISFLALAIASSLATIFLQKHVIEEAAERVPVPLRIENAIVSYFIYIQQLFFPSGLSAYYRFHTWGLPAGQVAMAVIFLAITSWAVFHWRKQHPYLPVGWLWYLAMLAPVIGFMQVGSQAHADRYTYLPEIGVGLLLTWLAADWFGRRQHGSLIADGIVAVIFGVLIYCSHIQVSYWRNGGTLWSRVVACDPYDARAHNNLGSYFYGKRRWDDAIAQFKTTVTLNPKFTTAYNYLGQAYTEEGKDDDAIPQFQHAIKLDPDYAVAHYNLGAALAKKGTMDQAIAEYRQALAINPALHAVSPDAAAMTMKMDYSLFHDALGIALAWEGRTDEAIVQYQEALKLNPNLQDASNNLANTLPKKGQPMDAKTHNNLGTTLRRQGRVDEAIIQYQEALKIDPRYAPAHYNLGNALLEKGDANEAILEYQTALKLKPDNMMIQKNLAHTVWMLATSPDPSARNGTNAVAEAQMANEFADGSSPVILRVLAAAYAECGNFPKAIEISKKAIALATEQQNVPLQNTLQREISLYRAGSPARNDPTNTDGW